MTRLAIAGPGKSEDRRIQTMQRRQFLRLVGSSLPAAFLPSLGWGGSRKTGDYNVLFISVDDLRPNLGCYGDSHAVTPNIDRLADSGVRFNRAYCQQAMCGPSRASVLTALRPDTIRVWDNRAYFRDQKEGIVTLPQHFKRNGYHSQSVGKIYSGRPDDELQDPPSWSVPEQYAHTDKKHQYALMKNRWGGKSAATESADVEASAYPDGLTTDEALRILERVQNERFFLAVGLIKPHLPFSAPKQYWDLYDREEFREVPDDTPPENVPPIALHNWKELRGYKDISKEGEIPPEKIAELIHGYYAAISFSDAMVGRLLEKLDQLGLTDNTVVILWGDHGYHLGEHDLWCKTTVFELDTRVPLIISAPQFRAQSGRATDALVEFVDMYPTLADLCGLSIPKELEGISAVPLMEDLNREWKTAAFSQFPHPPYREPEAMGYSMRTDRYRYTEWIEYESWKRQGKGGNIIARELYDHANDPREMQNIAGNPEVADQVAKLHRQLQTGWREALPSGVRKG